MKLTLALDWTPNTMHAGILVAEAKGYFEDNGLELEIVDPASDNYATTPAKKLSQKLVDLAIAPSESVISYHMRKAPTPLVAVAANLQKDTSAIVTLERSGIDRPAKMDGKTFASYDARFENDIIRQLVKNDGGKGEFEISNPAILSMWDALLESKADATWVFLPWEGMKAKYERDNLKFHAFQLANYDIPYGYSPLIISHQDIVDQKGAVIKAFLEAVEEGWRYVYESPGKAAKALHKHIKQPEFENLSFVEESLKILQPAITTSDDRWGFMEGERWVDFIDWMIQHQILKDEEGIPMNHGQIDSSMLYTNEFFKEV
ncbi:ABC transporter substrate-binding protein [Catalinimonas sp. 4WD22]|uniref:ABC transporter substrate-binding protein n=1 Tax=Catalinimonas locisalis TaxID=3133978 RepID=UPI00310156D7